MALVHSKSVLIELMVRIDFPPSQTTILKISRSATRPSPRCGEKSAATVASPAQDPVAAAILPGV